MRLVQTIALPIDELRKRDGVIPGQLVDPFP
jgi:hypothetical protein